MRLDAITHLRSLLQLPNERISQQVSRRIHCYLDMIDFVDVAGEARAEEPRGRFKEVGYTIIILHTALVTIALNLIDFRRC